MLNLAYENSYDARRSARPPRAPLARPSDNRPPNHRPTQRVSRYAAPSINIPARSPPWAPPTDQRTDIVGR